MDYMKGKVLSNELVATGTYKMVVEGDVKGKAGQFYMLKTLNDEFVLPRPISIHDIREGKIEFLYHVYGKGTKLISNLNNGEELNILGPLGNGFNIEEIKGNVAVVAGGIGVAPMNLLVKELNNNGVSADVYAGFKDEVYGAEQIKENAKSFNVATVDGTVGHKGFVTELVDYSKYDLVITCGPEVMMDKVVLEAKKANILSLASMEKRMACGIGACLVCTCKTKEGNKRSCKEGPVFSGEELIING